MKALIVVDVQNDFCPGGTLAVPDGDKIIPVINNLLPKFDIIIFTKDWHPKKMETFENYYTDKKAFEQITLENGTKDTIWTVHCVAETKGAELHKDIDFNLIKGDFYIFKKGMEVMGNHMYSGFDAPGLIDFFREKGVTEVHIVGLALEFCVLSTAIDSNNKGFDTKIILDGTRAISYDGYNTAIETLLKEEIAILNSKDIL